LVLLFAWLTLLAFPNASSAAEPRATLKPVLSNLGSTAVGIHHPPRGAPSRKARLATARAQATAYGGDYVAYTGEAVRVLTSDAFAPDDSVNQSWADFIAGLVHGFEIGRVTVYVAPLWEVQARCDEFSNACYLYASDLLIVPGDETGDGASLEDVAAHEYGHHIASWRKNPPWNAFDFGPKRWASYERICPRILEGSAFIGDPNTYHLDPGEAVAEAYQVLNGGQWGGIVDDSFLPNATSLRMLRKTSFHLGNADACTVDAAVLDHPAGVAGRCRSARHSMERFKCRCEDHV
jgi:hypothetical protein